MPAGTQLKMITEAAQACGRDVNDLHDRLIAPSIVLWVKGPTGELNRGEAAPAQARREPIVQRGKGALLGVVPSGKLCAQADSLCRVCSHR